MDQEADCLWVPKGSREGRPLGHTGRNCSGSRGPEQPHSLPPTPGHPPRHHSKVHTLWSILRPSVTTWLNQKEVIQPLLHTLGLFLNNHQLFFKQLLDYQELKTASFPTEMLPFKTTCSLRLQKLIIINFLIAWNSASLFLSLKPKLCPLVFIHQHNKHTCYANSIPGTPGGTREPELNKEATWYQVSGV